MQPIDSGASFNEQVRHVALAAMEETVETAVLLYKMSSAAIQGNLEEARNNLFLAMVNMVNFGKSGASPQAKRQQQLAVKQIDFLQQRIAQGVIRTSPLLHIAGPAPAFRQYVVESPRRDEGVPGPDCPD